jgi:hypothetical protein
VRSEPRRGFFVASGPALGRVSRHRHELERLYERFETEIVQATGLHPAGALRYLARLAEERESERPRCAFVECTDSQARGHATEVVDRLGVPCRALTLELLDGRRERVPLGVDTLLVSRFHVGELEGLEDSAPPSVVSVPVELSPELELPETSGAPALVLETDATEADDLLRDVRALRPSLAVEARVVEEVDGAVRELAGGHALLLSPRLWGWLDPTLRETDGVQELRFRIAPAAWDSIADALGLPLGDARVGLR